MSSQTLTEATQDSLGQMLDEIVHQYGDLLQDGTSEIRSDKENQSVCLKQSLPHFH